MGNELIIHHRFSFLTISIFVQKYRASYWMSACWCTVLDAALGSIETQIRPLCEAAEHMFFSMARKGYCHEN